MKSSPDTPETTRSHMYWLAGIWMVVHLILFRYPGIRADLFDARGYIKAADYLLMHGTLEVFRHIFYALPIFLIALFKLLAREWLVPFIVFQSVLSGVAAWSLYRAASRLFSSARAGLISALLFLLWWDVIQWNTAVMTESLAASVICILLFRLAIFKGTFIDYIWVAALSGISVFIRPTGVLIVFATLIFLLVWHWHLLPFKPYLRLVLVLVLLVGSCFAVTSMFSYWDFTEQYVKGNIVTYMDTVEGTALYEPDLRLDTSDLVLPPEDMPPITKIGYFVALNPEHFLTAAGLKVFYLVTGVRPYYSFWHNAYSLVWLMSVYVLLFIGVTRSRDRALTWFSLVLIVGNCALIAISTADWDNRFYAPMQPVIALLAGGGGACRDQCVNGTKE